MNFQYIFALFILTVFYVSCVYLMKHAHNTKLFNCLFVCCTYIPYLVLCQIVYMDVGFYDWNFQNVLPVANVSPFMFALSPLLLILPRRVRKHALLLVSLLSVGMMLSSVFGCIYNASINYAFHHHFLLDYYAHIFLSLFGIYVIRSRQVDLTLRNSLISGSIIVGSAVVMMILNVIFDTAFFGLSLNGKHNIYNNVLVSNSYLSAFLYFFGLCGVLLMGFGFSKIFADEKFRITDEEKNPTGSEKVSTTV